MSKAIPSSPKEPTLYRGTPLKRAKAKAHTGDTAAGFSAGKSQITTSKGGSNFTTSKNVTRHA